MHNFSENVYVECTRKLTGASAVSSWCDLNPTYVIPRTLDKFLRRALYSRSRQPRVSACTVNHSYVVCEYVSLWYLDQNFSLVIIIDLLLTNYRIRNAFASLTDVMFCHTYGKLLELKCRMSTIFDNCLRLILPIRNMKTSTSDSCSK